MITGASNSGPFYRDRTDFFRASSEPVFVDPGVTNAGSTSRNSGIATYDPVRDRVLLMNGASGGLWALQFDESTPARLDLIETETVGNDVRLRFAGDGYSGVVRVERRTDDDWTEIGVAMEMSPGLYEFLDTDVAPGEAHRYRGRWFADGEERTTSESAPVLVGHADPAAITLRARDGAIVRSGPLVFSCRLPVDGIGVLELIDVRGRIVGHAAFSAQAGLGVEVTVDGPRAARAGLYFARLRQGDAAVTLRVVRL